MLGIVSRGTAIECWCKSSCSNPVALLGVPCIDLVGAGSTVDSVCERLVDVMARKRYKATTKCLANF